MKLKTKIHSLSTLMMLIVLILSNLGIYFTFDRTQHHTEYSQLLGSAKELTVALSKMTDEEEAEIILRAYVPPNGALRVVGETGKDILTVQSMEGFDKKFPMPGKDEEYTLVPYEGYEALSIAIPTIWPTGEVMQLQMTQVLTDLKANLRLLRIVMISITLFAMIPIMISSITLGRIVTQPIGKLIQAMTASRRSGTFQRIAVPDDGKDELAQMGQTFNDLMIQLEQIYRKQEKFVSDASHELKTPITVIDSYARLLERRGMEKPKLAEEALGAIRSETKRMTGMIEQMLDLARNNEPASYVFEPAEIRELAEEAAAMVSRAYSREIRIAAPEHAEAVTDSQHLKQLMIILLDNARKYSEQPIDVSVDDKGADVQITIRDYGKGIPAKDIPFLFDRFYRVDEDRSRKTGGTGLGLSIANEIAIGLGAKLDIKSEEGDGTEITIHVLKSPASQ
ncbi:sensor histidine kinase [Sporosarcina trichiuri]|uniref:sensor histidine kinase n=1 Tax=Sporosarcina trichiuri TaxID=3056445 RepID=UPI0025B50AE6|nr:HAMP domain-containing sensor histidine kinase [Sporosarcina sp. 0.2-SM1T-5]WJY26643.1 HAMP domain-containing sensor histidine kinase [Sporosarcina sp. 0.2-SM1T-5]